MTFDIVDLRLFYHIEQCKSLTGAAALSHLSLAAASARIKNLEETIGGKLLFRGTQGVTLTPCGQAFGAHARLLLEQVERLRGDLQAHVQGLKGLLRISASSAPISEFLGPVIANYLASHPQVDIDLRERRSIEVVRSVREGQTDIGIVSGDVRTDGLEVIPYRDARLVLVVPHGHELEGKQGVLFSDALQYDYVSLHESNPIFQFLAHVAAGLNRVLRSRIHLSNFELACKMVESNVGICVLPDLAALRYAETMAIRVIRINDEWAVGHTGICMRNYEDLPLFARDFVTLLKNESQSPATRPSRSRKG